jgi:hypothetical protein
MITAASRAAGTAVSSRQRGADLGDLGPGLRAGVPHGEADLDLTIGGHRRRRVLGVAGREPDPLAADVRPNSSGTA